MARKATGWTCRAKSCKFRNPPRTRKCQGCGKARPARRAPQHRRVLGVMSYEEFVGLNGGDFCWIGRAVGAPCGADRDPETRRLHRDHDHSTGAARGLLCFPHNRLLAREWTPALLRAACAYLEQAMCTPHCEPVQSLEHT